MMKKFQGKVIHGVSVGTKFGIATANLQIENSLSLDFKHGVYFVHLYWRDTCYNGILHFGKRETFGGDVSIEAHILDFSQDIYGEIVEMEFLQFKRKTKVFQNADVLFTQIETDILQARKFFLRQEIYQQWEDQNKNVGTQNFASKIQRKNIIQKISTLPTFQSSQQILAYAPMKYEIPFIEEICKAFPEKTYHFPKIEHKEMKFYQSSFHDLKSGQYGILEPNITQLCDLSKIDFIFVPAVAIDNEKYRLGRGGGYYDRLLEKTSAFTTTVIPKFAFVPTVYPESHDQKVDEVIVIE